MQFINKSNIPPQNWDKWFTTANGRRSFDYKKDFDNLLELSKAREYLLKEQHHLCAYCQSKLTLQNSSIEHFIPKVENELLSTNYFNLVVVCKDSPFDSATRKKHCDKERESLLIPPLIFYKNAQVTQTKNHSFLNISKTDGEIFPKEKLPNEIQYQIWSFINILNLNHEVLKNKRKETLNGILELMYQIPRNERTIFIKTQNQRVLNDYSIPFRQFILIGLSKELGIN
jgi:uncharacterized protein (TIGR02646 family)